MRRILGGKERGGKYTMRIFITCTVHLMVKIIVTRRSRRAEHAALIGKMRKHKILVRKLQRKRPFEDLEVDGYVKMNLREAR
jgi:hypothetical protein